MVSKYEIPTNRPIDLSVSLGRRAVHIFKEPDVGAIHAALLSERPLLLRGDPGVGKTQFARAAAKALGREFVSKTVDARTETQELLWIDDPVGRLAQAQLVGAFSGQKSLEAYEDLDPARFARPGVLWWGLNWQSACERQKLCNPDGFDDGLFKRGENGVVVLIDEIDKADPSVPNALLEALGDRAFTPPGGDRVEGGNRPLIIVSTNQERELPAAFQRRCAEYVVNIPEGPALIPFLVARGQATFPLADFSDATDDVLECAAVQTLEDREAAREAGLKPAPGQAEYFDLLHALFSEDRDPAVPAKDALKRLAPYFLKKRLAQFE